MPILLFGLNFSCSCRHAAGIRIRIGFKRKKKIRTVYFNLIYEYDIFNVTKRILKYLALSINNSYVSKCIPLQKNDWQSNMSTE
ncbi:hypothetical protein T4D_14630 [Trichinella pseudospiralis]|uniref:Uncharacterized protein n=1 Tax=Trichinella pseudospiralis TaxID=6337 RepID=A0A0V1FWF7_TRIPS|nr:hypothetical protein T4D_14630 [Trichinella pseudospiralis]